MALLWSLSLLLYFLFLVQQKQGVIKWLWWIPGIQPGSIQYIRFICLHYGGFFLLILKCNWMTCWEGFLNWSNRIWSSTCSWNSSTFWVWKVILHSGHLRHDQRALEMETELSCRNGRGSLVTHFGWFFSSAPFEQQKQGLARGCGNIKNK